MEENQFYRLFAHRRISDDEKFRGSVAVTVDDPDSLVRQGTELLRRYPCADGFHFQVPVGDFASSLARTTEDPRSLNQPARTVVGGDHGVRGGPAPGPVWVRDW